MAGYIKELLFDMVYRSMNEETFTTRDEITYDFYGELIQPEYSDHVYRQQRMQTPAYVPVGGDIHIEKIDLQVGLQRLYDTGQITARHIYALDRYLSGWRIHELQEAYPDVLTLLIQTLSLLEEETQYTDEKFLNRALKDRQSLNIIRPALLKMLVVHGVSFE